MGVEIYVRDATLQDAAALAILAGQLGYFCTENQVREGMTAYIGDPDSRIVVVENKGTVVAWMSLDVVRHFYVLPYVEISGLVVDEKERRHGVGKILLLEAETWASELGYGSLRVRTNAKRRDAQAFYENLGFQKTKKQFVYTKDLQGKNR